MSDENVYEFQTHSPITEPAQRIVSLVPSLTETLFDLNLGNRVVGVTDYCVYPREAVARLPRVGGTKNPDVDAVLSLDPDLIFANPEENRQADVEAFQAAGIPVWVTHPRTIQDVFNHIWEIMDIFHATEMVPRIRLIEHQYDWVSNISQQHDDRGEVVRTFVPIWLDPLMTANSDTYLHDVVRTCGGTNVFADRERRFPLQADLGQADAYAGDDARVQGRDTRYPRITLEEVEFAQPDVILLPSEPFAFNESHIALFASLDVPAAHNNRIHLVDGALLTWHGTRVAYALNDLPPLFFPPEEIE